jgi:hypothetical protein
MAFMVDLPVTYSILYLSQAVDPAQGESGVRQGANRDGDQQGDGPKKVETAPRIAKILGMARRRWRIGAAARAQHQSPIEAAWHGNG